MAELKEKEDADARKVEEERHEKELEVARKVAELKEKQDTDARKVEKERHEKELEEARKVTELKEKEDTDARKVEEERHDKEVEEARKGAELIGKEEKEKQDAESWEKQACLDAEEATREADEKKGNRKRRQIKSEREAEAVVRYMTLLLVRKGKVFLPLLGLE